RGACRRDLHDQPRRPLDRRDAAVDVEAPSVSVDRVYCNQSPADEIGGVDDPLDGIEQQLAAQGPGGGATSDVPALLAILAAHAVRRDTPRLAAVGGAAALGARRGRHL